MLGMPEDLRASLPVPCGPRSSCSGPPSPLDRPLLHNLWSLVRDLTWPFTPTCPHTVQDQATTPPHIHPAGPHPNPLITHTAHSTRRDFTPLDRRVLGVMQAPYSGWKKSKTIKQRWVAFIVNSWAPWRGKGLILTRCSLVTPYGNIDNGQQIMVNIGSDKGLMPNTTKPLPEPMLTLLVI